MDEDIVIHLPSISRVYETGIAASSESGVAAGLTLPVLVGEGITAAKSATNAPIWAYSVLNTKLKLRSAEATQSLTACAYSRVYFGLVRKRAGSDNPDGESFQTSERSKSVKQSDIEDFVSADLVERVLTIIIATKANF